MEVEKVEHINDKMSVCEGEFVNCRMSSRSLVVGEKTKCIRG